MFERFVMYRDRDVTGYSGTGKVAEGVVFSDGTVALRWAVYGKPKTTALYSELEDLLDIHGHDGATRLIWIESEDQPSISPGQIPLSLVEIPDVNAA